MTEPVQPSTDPNTVNQSSASPTQPHQPVNRPVVVQTAQPDMSEFMQAIRAVPEQIVNALKEGAQHVVPPATPPASAASQPQSETPAAQQVPPTGQQTAETNLNRSGRQPSRFHKWWNGGQR